MSNIDALNGFTKWASKYWNVNGRNIFQQFFLRKHAKHAWCNLQNAAIFFLQYKIDCILLISDHSRRRGRTAK